MCLILTHDWDSMHYLYLWICLYLWRTSWNFYFSFNLLWQTIATSNCRQQFCTYNFVILSDFYINFAISYLVKTICGFIHILLWKHCIIEQHPRWAEKLKLGLSVHYNWLSETQLKCNSNCKRNTSSCY